MGPDCEGLLGQFSWEAGDNDFTSLWKLRLVVDILQINHEILPMIGKITLNQGLFWEKGM